MVWKCVCVCARFCKRNLRWCFLLVSVLTPFAITRVKSFTSTVDNAVIPKLLHNILPQVSIDLARCSEGFCIDVCLRFQLIPSHSFHALLHCHEVIERERHQFSSLFFSVWSVKSIHITRMLKPSACRTAWKSQCRWGPLNSNRQLWFTSCVICLRIVHAYLDINSLAVEIDGFPGPCLPEPCRS